MDGKSTESNGAKEAGIVSFRCEKHPKYIHESFTCPLCEAYDDGYEEGLKDAGIEADVSKELQKLEHNLESMLKFIHRLQRKC